MKKLLYLALWGFISQASIHTAAAADLDCAMVYDMTAADVSTCVTQSEKEMAEPYQKLYDIYKERTDVQPALESAQKAWLAHRDAHCQFVSLLDKKDKDRARNACIADANVNRTQEFMGYLDNPFLEDLETADDSTEVGAYIEASVNDTGVQKAAEAAASKAGGKLKQVLNAETQLVAGMNYRLKIELEDGSQWNAVVFKGLIDDTALEVTDITKSE